VGFDQKPADSIDSYPIEIQCDSRIANYEPRHSRYL
jgi:hypothetical protein